MTAVVCLQGGAEFRPGCEEMDAELVAAGQERAERVVVAPFAGRPGRERRMAGENARRWYAGLGAGLIEVVEDEGEAFGDRLAGAGLLVLPGGSPQRLLEALRPWADALRAAVEDGTAVSGSSAGAMVVCRSTVLPGGSPRVVPGLGLVPVDLVLPHFDGRTGWLDAARGVLPADAVVLGLPERSGVVVSPDGELRAVGMAPFRRLPAPASSEGDRG